MHSGSIVNPSSPQVTSPGDCLGKHPDSGRKEYGSLLCPPIKTHTKAISSDPPGIKRVIQSSIVRHSSLWALRDISLKYKRETISANLNNLFCCCKISIQKS